MKDLFEPVSRDDRQEESRLKWIRSKCKGTIEACTGYGKTRVALNCLCSVLKKYPNVRILVVVPTELLKEQWVTQLTDRGIFMNAEVVVINTVIKHDWKCDILVIDEIHRVAADTFQEVFNKVKYKLILGLTATLKRLDERHTIIEKYCPVIDNIPLEVAEANGWVSSFTEYKVYIETDLTQYNQYNKEFNEHFGFFNYNWNLAVSMLGPKGFKKRIAYRDLIYTGNDKTIKSNTLKLITYHATGLMRTVQQRKAFINGHPDKIRLTREIIKHRPNSKIITFSATTKIAESIGIGNVYTGKDSKKKGRTTIEEFSKQPTGVLNTVKKADEGMDIPGLSVAIILGMDSSNTKRIQRTGRVIRKEGNKHAEIFTFVIKNTVEEEWYNKSHATASNVITINEENLMHVLRGEPYETYKKPPAKFSFRF